MNMTTRRAAALATPPKLKKGDSDDESNHYMRKIVGMQHVIDVLKGKINAQEEELNSVKATLQHITSVMEPYCMTLEKRFADRILVTDTHVESKYKELTARLDTITGEVEIHLKALKDRADVFDDIVKKNGGLMGSIADLQSSIREQEAGQSKMKSDISVAVERLNLMQNETMSYKEALKAGTPAAMNRSAPIESSTYATMPATRCIIKTPRGFIQGAGAANRAKAFNAKVLSKLEKLEGHFTLPEVTGLVLVEPKEGMVVRGDMWIAYLSSASDVTKLFAYKAQLRNVCPDVYVQPDLPKEIRMQRKLLHVGALQFIKNQATPDHWRFKWVENLKIMIRGPADAKRYVVVEDGAARVVSEGNVRVVAVDKGKGKVSGLGRKSMNNANQA
jgi:hypothetical protein